MKCLFLNKYRDLFHERQGYFWNCSKLSVIGKFQYRRFILVSAFYDLKPIQEIELKAEFIDHNFYFKKDR
jgi:hypothetical protein